MSALDLAALHALCGEALLSLDSARLMLDEARVTADDLEAEGLRPVWALLESRIRERRPLDGPSMCAALPTSMRGVLSEALALPALGVLPDRLAALREASVRRRAMEGLRQAAEALKTGRPLAEVAGLAREVPTLLEGVRGRVRETRGDTVAILDAAAQAWSEGRRVSLATGWRDLDEELRFVPNLHVVGAHPGVGKSALVAGLVRQWTRARVKVGVLAYEDDALDMQRRILACDAELSLAQMQGDVVPDAAQYQGAERACLARQGLEEFLLADDATPAGTIDDAVASIREMHARGCRAVVLDNMSCVRLDARDERHFEIEGALIKLRSTAVALKMPVLVIGHLKRGQSDGDELTKRPKLTDFAGAAAWERTARSACGMWWEDNQVRMRILKQTNGKTGGEFVVHVQASAATVVGVESWVAPERPAMRRHERREAP